MVQAVRVGYEEVPAAIKDPKDEEHENMLICIGGGFDPEGFDLNAINRMLRCGQSPRIPQMPHIRAAH